jgi:hypothetical protein
MLSLIVRKPKRRGYLIHQVSREQIFKANKYFPTSTINRIRSFAITK